jgi:hypothetical protein
MLAKGKIYLGMVEHNVLPDEHADAHAGEVESVEELAKVKGHAVKFKDPRLREDIRAHVRELLEAPRNVCLHAIVFVLDVLEHLGELFFESRRVWLGEAADPEEAPLVQFSHALDRGRVAEAKRELLELARTSSEADRELLVEELKRGGEGGGLLRRSISTDCARRLWMGLLAWLAPAASWRKSVRVQLVASWTKRGSQNCATPARQAARSSYCGCHRGQRSTSP